MSVNLHNDGANIRNALQRAGYDFSGSETNLIRARLDRGTQTVELYIDGSGAVRVQITSGSDEQEQYQHSGRLEYTITQQGRTVTNLTTKLQQADDISTLIQDINKLAAGQPLTSSARAQRPSPTNPPNQHAGDTGDQVSRWFGHIGDHREAGDEQHAGSQADDPTATSYSNDDNDNRDKGGRLSANDLLGREGNQ